MERRGAGRDHDVLLARITGRTATVCVLGQGYVGLSVAAGAAAVGMTAYGVDVDVERAAALAGGTNVVPGVDEALFRTAHDSGRLLIGTDPAVVAAADVVLLCVPTPVADSRPDLSMIEAAGRTVAAHLTPGALVVLESTTYPGTTEQVLRPLLEASGLLAGQDFLLACSAYPEEEPHRSEFEAEAREHVTRLAAHPSLVLWNGGNENLWGHEDWGWKEELGDLTWGLGYYTDLFPGIVAELDPTRPYAAGSPVSPRRDPAQVHPNDPDHGSHHQWEVWNRIDYAHYRDDVPRFSSEFGFQAPPTWATT